MLGGDRANFLGRLGRGRNRTASAEATTAELLIQRPVSGERCECRRSSRFG